MPVTPVFESTQTEEVAPFVLLDDASTFRVHCAYARAKEKQRPDTQGEDFLSVAAEGPRLAFALCDGVGTSFLSYLSSRALGKGLVNWLWTESSLRQVREEAAVTEAARRFLEDLARRDGEAINHYELPDHLPKIFRSVLLQKQAEGSKSVFVAGLLDLECDQVVLIWMGDCRLRLWTSEGEWNDRLRPEDFQLQDHWSSQDGPVGHPHVLVLRASEIERIAGYSDGLTPLDGERQAWPQPEQLNRLMRAIEQTPRSDDISYIHILLPGAAWPEQPFQLQLNPPTEDGEAKPPSPAASHALPNPQARPERTSSAAQPVLDSHSQAAPQSAAPQTQAAPTEKLAEKASPAPSLPVEDQNRSSSVAGVVKQPRLASGPRTPDRGGHEPEVRRSSAPASAGGMSGLLKSGLGIGCLLLFISLVLNAVLLVLVFNGEGIVFRKATATPTSTPALLVTPSPSATYTETAVPTVLETSQAIFPTASLPASDEPPPVASPSPDLASPQPGAQLTPSPELIPTGSLPASLETLPATPGSSPAFPTPDPSASPGTPGANPE